MKTHLGITLGLFPPLNSVTATVSGTKDLAGNTYSGTDSIAIMVDNIPTVTLTDTDSDNVVSDSDEVTITATFSESIAATPTISLSGLLQNARMSATSSDSVWSFTWTVSTSSKLSNSNSLWYRLTWKCILEQIASPSWLIIHHQQ